MRLYTYVLSSLLSILAPVLAESALLVQSSLYDIPDTSINDATNASASASPFYTIAHRVLVIKGVIDALRHGANALEMDMTAWRGGWWADHDGTLFSAGDKAEDMFIAIRKQREAGQAVTFVWLDIKNPDYCDPDDKKWRHCSIDALRDLARKHLEPVGVRVLYGFYHAKGKAYFRVRDNLFADEAINLNGPAHKVASQFEQRPSNRSKKVMSYGYYNLGFEFGGCHERRYYTCTELRMGVELQKFGKVFGWTSAVGQAKLVGKLLGDAGIDGLVYGFKATHYYDHWQTRSAAADISRWVHAHPDKRFIATNDYPPW